MSIDALRHGEAEGGPRYRGSTDDPLTESGWMQMWGATDGRCWDAIVTSPSRRCADFAQTFADRHEISLRVDERLREMNFGAWEGKTAAQLIESSPMALADFWRDPWNYPPPGAESLFHVQQRVLAAWHDAVASRRATLLVTHGGPIRILLCHLGKLAPKNILNIEVPHASLHRLTAPTIDIPIPEQLR